MVVASSCIFDTKMSDNPQPQTTVDCPPPTQDSAITLSTESYDPSGMVEAINSIASHQQSVQNVLHNSSSGSVEVSNHERARRLQFLLDNWTPNYLQDQIISNHTSLNTPNRHRLENYLVRSNLQDAFQQGTTSSTHPTTATERNPTFSLRQIITDRKTHRRAVQVVLALWYTSTLIATPAALLLLGGHGLCGTNATVVHGLGDSTDTLYEWLVCLIAASVVDVARVAVITWARRYKDTISVAGTLYRWREGIMWVVWTCMGLWLMAGTAWVAGSTCQETNPALYTYSFFLCFVLWGIVVVWYVISRCRSWHLQSVDMERAQVHHGMETEAHWRDAMQVQQIAMFGDPATGSIVYGSVPRRLRPLYAGARPIAVHYDRDYAIDGYAYHVPNSRPPLPADFWRPVDPASVRPVGEGVRKEVWETLRVFEYGRTPEMKEVGLVDREDDGSNQKELQQVADSKYYFDGCIICLCEYEGGDIVRELHCLHTYHDACIAKWLRGISEGGQGKRTCPICVSSVDSGDCKESE